MHSAADPSDSGLGLRATSRSVVATTAAFAQLVDAEVDLAVSTLPRVLLAGALTAAFAASSVVLLAGLIMALAVAMGASWPLALAIASGLTLTCTLACALYAHRLLRDCTLPATRRQIHAWWPEDTSPEEGTDQSVRTASKSTQPTTVGAAP